MTRGVEQRRASVRPPADHGSAFCFSPWRKRDRREVINRLHRAGELFRIVSGKTDNAPAPTTRRATAAKDLLSNVYAVKSSGKAQMHGRS